MAKKDDGTKVVGKNANKYRATAPIKIRHTSKNVTSGKKHSCRLGTMKTDPQIHYAPETFKM